MQSRASKIATHPRLVLAQGHAVDRLFEDLKTINASRGLVGPHGTLDDIHEIKSLRARVPYGAWVRRRSALNGLVGAQWPLTLS